MQPWLILIGVIVIGWTIGWIFKYLEARRQISRIEIQTAKEELEKERQNILAEKVKNQQYREAIDVLAHEKSAGFPWLARAYADYSQLRLLQEATNLENKPHPARISAERVRAIARERRIIEEKLRIAQATIEYYQDLFPFLEEFLDETEDDLLRRVLSRNIEEPVRDVGDIGIDPVRVYLSPEEYRSLSTAERNQRALDSYGAGHKSKWQVGRDYERYIGYLHETDGYNVYYQGILEGYDDMGRDLIACKDAESIVIQCKRWSQHKVIHEKHVCQLHGTVVKYKLDHPNEHLFAMLYTTTKLSDRAREFAEYLRIGIAEEFALQDYPLIKCNVSRRTGEKIYHLPFDQQYDRVLIEEERNECYVRTVAEAENLGYRRAWRWRGNEETTAGNS